jgi:hypothetical protein
MKRNKTISVAIIGILLLSTFLILVPSVTSDGEEGNTARAADVMMVCDDVRGTPAQFWTAVMAVQMLGYSVQAYGTESAVPSNWDLQGYKAVFWMCGGYPPNFWQGISSTNRGKLLNFIYNGGHVFYSGDSVYYAVSWDWNMADYLGHYYFGPSGGGGSICGWTYSVSNPAHPINNDPNLLPSTFVSYGYNVVWYTPSYLRNNGLGVIRTPNLSPSSSITDQMVIVWEPSQDPAYPGGSQANYGKTVYLRTCFLDQFASTSAGNMITPFMQNVATWLLGSTGIAADVRMEPQSLNLDSNGNYVQFKVTGFPENPEYSSMDVDGSTCQVAGVNADLKFGTYADGKYIGKADRLLVEDAIGGPGDETEVQINGQLADGTGFMGVAIIKTLDN